MRIHTKPAALHLFSILAFVCLFAGVRPAAAWAAAENMTLLVLPFQINADEELDYLNLSLPQLLNDALGQKGFQMVGQEKMSRLIEEQQVEYLDLAVARDLALLAGADYAIYGSFSQVGEALSLDVRVVEAFGVKPAKPVFVVKEGLINIMPAVEELADKITQELLRKEVVAEILVRGVRGLNPDVVLMRLRMQEGDAYDPKQITTEIKRIYDLGYFEDVQATVEDIPEGRRVIFEVKEKPIIGAIGVVGNGEMDADDILEVMNTKTGAVLNDKVLSQDLAAVLDLYRQKGFYLAEVDFELEGEETGQARLNVVVEEGQELYITEVRVEGAKELDPDDLKDQLALAERSWLSWLTGTGVLKEELLERDAAALETYAANRGFMDAKVGAPDVKFTPDGIHITFTIQEGDRYKPSSVSFAGDLLEPEEKLRELIQMDNLVEEDAYFDRSVLRDDAQLLTDFYSDYGYAYAESDYRLDKDNEAKTIGVTYLLQKNQKVYIRRVVIEGNTKTRDNVIRRQLRLADGDMFSGSKLARSSQRLNRLDYFETVDIETVPTSEPGEMDLRVKVKEKSTGMLAGGVGYSSYSGAFISAKLLEQNLFGKGWYAGLSASIGGKSTNYSLSFTDPYFFDSNIGAGVDLYLNRYDYDDYDKTTQGGRLRFTYPLGEYTRLYWNYRLDRYDIYNVNDGAAEAIREVKGVNWSSVAKVGAKRDTTDTLFNPTEGMISEVYAELGGSILMGDDHFLKTVAKNSWYYTLIEEWQHVLHLHAEAGYIFDVQSGEDIPVFERFYLGGINSVRGYESRRISPIDGSTGDRVGGNKKFVGNVEYIFPLEREMGLVGLFFFDFGYAWKEGDWDMAKLRRGVGTGIRWYSPFGPLRIEYGYALDDIPNQGSKHKLEFSMGTFF